MKKKYLLLAFFFSIISISSFAQLDSVFWFGAPDLQGAHGDRPIFLRASSGKDPAVITISIPANTSFVPIVVNLAANSSQSIDLTSFIDLIENGIPNIASNKGLKISSTSLISVYYDIAHGLNGDIYPLKGVNALGFKFTIPFQMDFPGNIPSYKSTFVILATENDTRITIRPKSNLTGMQAGVPVTITLQKGQTYTCEASENTANKRPGGTVVESNKRITISTKDDSINYLTWGCADTAGDQIIPDCNAGNDFAIMKGYLFGADYYYVFAISDNTVVKVNGNVVSTINAGNYYRGLLSDPSCYIETSNPVHVFHISGFGCELGGAVLPSLMNDGSSSVSLTRASNEELFINILAPASIISSFKINGSSTLIDASKFVAVPSTNGKWMTARINLPQSIVPAGGNFQIVNSLGKFHAGMIHGGQSSTCRYGYFSDFARSNIDLVGYDTLYCAGANVSIRASGQGLSNVKWKLPSGTEINGSLLSINNFNTSNEGIYFVSGNDSRCGFVERKITLQLQKVKSDFAIPPAQCFTGNNFKFISTSNVNAGSIKQELWDFGDGSTATGSNVSHTYKSPGNYQVTLVAVGNNNCKDTIIKQITVYPSPIVSLKSDVPIILCKGESVLLNVPKVAGQTYQWSLGGTVIAGATQDILRVSKDGVYSVSVQNSFGCSANGSSIIRIVDADIVQSDTTICGGTSITLGPISVKAGQTVLWSNGATSPSIVVNPTVKTKYLVSVTDGTTTCADSVVVDVRSSELRLTNPAAVCSPAEINLTASAVTAGSTPGLFYTYWKDANATQNLVNPDKVSVSGTYYMVGTSAAGCKSDPTPVVVTVNPLPVATIVTPLQTTICDKSPLTLTATGGTSYQWLLNGAVIAGATGSTYAASLAGSYEVNVIALGCTSKVATPVNLSLIKAAVPKFSNSIACVDVPVSFFNESDTLSSGLVNWAWDFGDSQTSTISNPVHTYRRAATFVVKLTVTPKLCSSLPASFTRNMTVENPPPGIKYPNVYAIKNKATQLSARFIANGYSYLWTPSFGLNNGAIQKPIFNASNEQFYRVRLTSAVGCVTIDSVRVSVFENSDIFVPKAFSPNKDGKNDLLFPFLVNIKTLNFFRIYNRWGQLMFQTSNSNQGWDGIYNNIPQPLDTYTWVVEGIDVNGVTIFKKGQTVLLR